MPAELTPLKRFECTYDGCAKSFDTEKEMKRHKLDAPEHDYCKKCGVDCKDWDDLTQHKVDKMAPFLEGKKRNSGESPAHIVCEFCGEDFKSFGGRERHRKQNHPADQSITCPGCSSLFTKASGMIAHLEKGHCPAVSKHQFKGHVQQKYVVSEIMKAPDVFQNNLEGNKLFLSTCTTPGPLADGPESQEQDEGGVPLIDQEDEAMKGGYRPLVPEVDLMSRDVPMSHGVPNAWPRLAGQAPSRLTDSMRIMSVSSTSQVSSRSASEYASDITSRRGGVRVTTESQTGTSGPPSSYGQDDDDTASEATTVPFEIPAGPSMSDARGRPAPQDWESRLHTMQSERMKKETEAQTKLAEEMARLQTASKAPAWASGSASKTLFKDAKPTPVPAGYEEVLLARQLEADRNSKNNLLTARFWDPSAPDYNPDLFFQPLISKYCCPFPDCGETHDAPYDIEQHLLYAHTRSRMRCPACSKLYKSATALVSHFESNGKCEVQKSAKFKKILDEISGGFLKAKHIEQPKIYRPETAVVKADGTQAGGVMETMYKAKFPHER